MKTALTIVSLLALAACAALPPSPAAPPPSATSVNRPDASPFAPAAMQP